MSKTQIHDLPAVLRAWSLTRRVPFRGRGRVGASMVRRLIDPAHAYRSAEAYVLSIDPNDRFQAWMLLGVYEQRLTAALARHATPDSVALDVGSHIGYHALTMARGVGRHGEVHAFDPDPRAYELLRRHVELNDARQISTNKAAVGDRSGTVDLNVDEQLGWSSTKPIRPGHQTVRVPVLTIDSYVERERIDPARVSLVKIDVESAELEALRGMRSLLTEGAPVTIVEVMPDRPHQRAAEISALMGSLGYSQAPTVDGLIFTR